ncbi:MULTISPECIES: hypothetical protein [unclassified Algoriphagus]|uniref:hypothetical protein n=2 Tax=Algoriphagus TaxID=246875 RepID=UPI001C62DEC6|nr:MULTISPECIES: hypothetical protein [unclassified Algoriphagus]QYH39549.1 hypothetical protein GYM62_12445 [Algoriphagus sp. NBT04N3]
MKYKSHLIWMGVITLLVMSLVEYLGWRIVRKYSGESAEHGFFSVQGLIGILENCIGAFVFGLIFVGLAFIIPSFRNNWKHRYHQPAWVGVLFFCIILLIVTVWGFFSS